MHAACLQYMPKPHQEVHQESTKKSTKSPPRGPPRSPPRVNQEVHQDHTNSSTKNPPRNFTGGPLHRTQVNEIFRAASPHNRADICITREKNNHQFFIYGPQYTKMCIFGYSGGPGWPINNRTGPILLPRHPLTYINLHIKYGSNPIRIF